MGFINIVLKTPPDYNYGFGSGLYPVEVPKGTTWGEIYKLYQIIPYSNVPLPDTDSVVQPGTYNVLNFNDEPI